MQRFIRLRSGLALALVAGALVAALSVPIPTAPDAGRSEVLAQLRHRLPGWQIERLEASWEGSYSIVTSCAGRAIGFQFVPEHGLPVGDAWLQPSDPYSRERLDELSDHYRHLIWYGDPALTHVLSCSDEIARDERADEVAQTGGRD
jgi:hypothetical protein